MFRTLFSESNRYAMGSSSFIKFLSICRVFPTWTLAASTPWPGAYESYWLLHPQLHATGMLGKAGWCHTALGIIIVKGVCRGFTTMLYWQCLGNEEVLTSLPLVDGFRARPWTCHHGQLHIFAPRLGIWNTSRSKLQHTKLLPCQLTRMSLVTCWELRCFFFCWDLIAWYCGEQRTLKDLTAPFVSGLGTYNQWQDLVLLPLLHFVARSCISSVLLRLGRCSKEMSKGQLSRRDMSWANETRNSSRPM